MFPGLGDQVGGCFEIARICETKVINDGIESLAKIRVAEFLDLRFMFPGHHRQIPARPLGKLSEDCQLRCVFVIRSRFVGKVENFFGPIIFTRHIIFICHSDGRYSDGRYSDGRYSDGRNDDAVEANQTKQDAGDANKHGRLRMDRWIEVAN